MSNGTLIQQGSFTGTGNNYTLKLRSGFDWLEITNFTQCDAANNGYGVKYYWQYGMGTKCLMDYHPAGDQTLAVDAVTNAVEMIDLSTYTGGAWSAVTAGTNATQPVYTIASSAGLTTGCVVRMKSTTQTNINGLDFTVYDIDNGGTNMKMQNVLATAPGIVAGAAGYYKLLAPNIETYKMFTPSLRVISKIDVTAATAPIITTLVDHNFTVGQRVRFKVPSDFGMIELTDKTAIITAVSTSTFTIDFDTTGYTAFAFATYASSPLDYPTVVQAGESRTYINSFDDATTNQGYTGVILTGGTAHPGGNNTDVIYWRAGKSFRVV